MGTKKWFLFPPTQQNWGPDAFGMPVLQWVETVLPKLKEQGIGPIELVQQAGEVLFVRVDTGTYAGQIAHAFMCADLCSMHSHTNSSENPMHLHTLG